MPGIFISYRRDDSSAYAGRIYDRLVSRFGEGNVFMDVDGLKPGDDFIDVLQKTVGSCDVLIAVIGRNWLSIQDQAGHKRLTDPEDFVRLEIGTALERGIRSFPLWWEVHLCRKRRSCPIRSPSSLDGKPSS
jgi:hypothetical protein